MSGPRRAVQISNPSSGAQLLSKKYFNEKKNILMKFDNGPKATNWPSILGGPNSWSWGRVRSRRLNIKIIFLLPVLTPSVKALGPISKIQPMGIKDLASKQP
jgi:hypothetical protein